VYQGVRIEVRLDVVDTTEVQRNGWDTECGSGSAVGGAGAEPITCSASGGRMSIGLIRTDDCLNVRSAAVLGMFAYAAGVCAIVRFCGR
jgi:hypothetical protein